MHAAQKLIVVGTSTGGLVALKTLLNHLPAGLPAAVLVTMDLSDGGVRLADQLAATSSLPVRFARDRELISPGCVLIAPRDAHLLIDHGRVNLLAGVRGYSRPAIDAFFRSAAISHRRNTIGVVLTGDLDDGTVGLQAIKACGGLTLVQDPAEAAAPSMPSSALQYVDPHFCLPVVAIAQQLARLVGHVIEPVLQETLHTDRRKHAR